MADQKPGDQKNDPLFANKVAGALLAALLLVFGLPQLANALFGGGHHGGEEELHLAYCCVELEAGAHGGAGDEPAFDLGAALAAADPAAGQRRSAICASCHSFEKGGPNGTGPNLWDIVGRDVAGVSGFGYTGALEAAGGQWTYERLDEYLKNSQAYIPGTAMVQRFPQDDRRVQLLAYLATLSDNPVAFPDPAPAEAPAEAEEHAEEGAAEAEMTDDPMESETTVETAEEVVETMEEATEGE